MPRSKYFSAGGVISEPDVDGDDALGAPGGGLAHGEHVQHPAVHQDVAADARGGEVDGDGARRVHGVHHRHLLVGAAAEPHLVAGDERHGVEAERCLELGERLDGRVRSR
jgi:hypothetical protein